MHNIQEIRRDNAPKPQKTLKKSMIAKIAAAAIISGCVFLVIGIVVGYILGNMMGVDAMFEAGCITNIQNTIEDRERMGSGVNNEMADDKDYDGSGR